MILGFKPQFVDLINGGFKIHSIREDKTNRWKEGNTIHFATGVRTKKYNNFKRDVCKRIQSVTITYQKDSSIEVWIGGILYATYYGEHTTMEDRKRLNLLARFDGFNCVADFFKWFNKDFKGKIIHWTNFKYTEEVPGK